MNRRCFISSIARIVPASLVAPAFLFSSCAPGEEDTQFSPANIQLLDDIGETIIPATAGSPGAKAAQIGEFMKVYVTDCYTAAEQQSFWAGVVAIKKLSDKKYGKDFQRLTLSQKKEILRAFENEPTKQPPATKVEPGKADAVKTGKTQQEIQNRVKADTPQFYPLLKNLVLFGYFTSQPGATKALRYVQSPGAYHGMQPYKPGDKAWAT